MNINKKDPFGFNKAINMDKLKDPEVLKVLEDAFKDNTMYMTIKERKEYNKKIREKNNMIKYVIHAKEWRDKINGNSYHSVNVLNTQNNLMIASPFTYGYGDQFLQTASETMIKQGWIKERLKSLDFLQIHNIVEKNCTKKRSYKSRKGKIKQQLKI